MRIAITTLGCKINQYESDLLRQDFAARGDVIVPFEAEADVYVINTCSVTAKSDVQSRQLIRAAARRTGAKVVVTGCYAETRPEELRDLPGVYAVVGNTEKAGIPLRFLPEEHEAAEREVNQTAGSFRAVRTRTRAFLKIQDGCNNRCTYCIVPLARGVSRSITPEQVLEETDRLAASKCPEIVLTGIHIGAYGSDLKNPLSIAEMVSRIIGRAGSSRIRLSSIEPTEVSDDLIEMLGKGLCRHLHIPLQSGDDTTLKRMNRNYSVSFYADLLKRIDGKVPDVALGADVMVGFPGETDAEFQNTVKLIEQSPLTHLHVFSYSKRPGTIAADMQEQVSDAAKKERSEVLRSIGRQKNIAFAKKMVGKTLHAVVEHKQSSREGAISGLSDNYLRMHIRNAESQHIGKLIPVKIIEASEGRIFAEIL